MSVGIHLYGKKLTVRPILLWLIALLLVSLPMIALAEDAITMPYEQGLSAFKKSLKGPVPFAISLVGIVACGAMLIFGGEISGFMRTMLFIILVVAVIVQAGSFVEMLGGKDSDTTGSVDTVREAIPARTIVS